MNFTPALPKPFTEIWREAYRYNEKDSPRKSSYQAPGKTPVPFILGTTKLTGGFSVDTSEYPTMGYWSNVPRNEKPQTLLVTGYLRGDNYIKERNTLIESLRILTSDEDPGYLELPLWGRFPVIVTNWDVSESGGKNGQCEVSIGLTRTGMPELQRRDTTGVMGLFNKLENTADSLKDAAVLAFESAVDGINAPDTIADSFTQIKTSLLDIAGRIQGSRSSLNEITGGLSSITNLLAQGERNPRKLASALFDSGKQIVDGIIKIRDTFDDPELFFTIKDNVKNMLQQLLGVKNFFLDVDTVTIKQQVIKEEAERLFKITAFSAASQLMTKLEDPTFSQINSYWKLLQDLEGSINMDDTNIYTAVQEIFMTVAEELSSKNIAAELTTFIKTPIPLPFLAQMLSCDEKKLRRLNNFSDSFLVEGEVIYV
ncbi:DNA circularization N-terminal domain-containing protein [Breznakiella homolactica]|uniref:DNA circularization N-terminal domain-containing protein n=1 Tax=Breznakiella homolactica TaxID=2798577 RepID=A0A7T7XQ35_9SPIR|nr:DNA circularization N-terminal domain-containing protein [Breznakiella homolactica]QQO10318.1 DNA circularization N-terminal domain-containing protein [Breznakiella homolactica]